jgi:hypothetical protein
MIFHRRERSAFRPVFFSAACLATSCLAALCLATLCPATSCLATPLPAPAGRWTLGGSLGLASPYVLYRMAPFLPGRGDTYDELPGTWMLGLNATHMGRGRLGLRLAARWSPYEREELFRYGVPPGVQRPSDRLFVDVVTLGLGARLQSAGRTSAVYLDVVPVLHLYAWRHRVAGYKSDLAGNAIFVVDQESVTRWKPGLELDLGGELRMTRHLRTDAGFRYLMADSPGRIPFVKSRPGPVRGLLQGGMYLGLEWAL